MASLFDKTGEDSPLSINARTTQQNVRLFSAPRNGRYAFHRPAGPRTGAGVITKDFASDVARPDTLFGTTCKWWRA